MSTKFSKKNPNPNVPVYVRDAARDRQAGIEAENDRRSIQVRGPFGGKGSRKIRRNMQRLGVA